MSVFIQITTKLAVTSNDDCWRLSKLESYTKKLPDGSRSAPMTRWKSFKYYVTLEHCVAAAGQLLLRQSDAKSADELIRAAGEISLLLSQKFTASSEVRLK